MTTGGESNVIKAEDLEVADAQLSSLLSKCEAVMSGTSLSPSRQTLMTKRVSALRTALELVRQAKARENMQIHVVRRRYRRVCGVAKWVSLVGVFVVAFLVVVAPLARDGGPGPGVREMLVIYCALVAPSWVIFWHLRQAGPAREDALDEWHKVLDQAAGIQLVLPLLFAVGFLLPEGSSVGDGVRTLNRPGSGGGSESTGG